MITATATGLTSDTSSFSVSGGTGTTLAFTTSPSGCASGVACSNQPTVTVQDAFGNTATSSTPSITLAISAQPGSGATLGCTNNPKSAVAGVDTFQNCQITGVVGTNSYVLSAAASGFTTVTSSAFSLTFGSANKLVFTTSPNGGTAGVAWSTQPEVTVEDSAGNTVTSSSASITLAINPGSPGTTGLTCTTNPLAASSGVANFGGCKIGGLAGNNYSLRATASGLTQGTSGTFSIAAGTGSVLVFTTQPGGGSAGSTWSTQPAVSIEDGFGNVVGSPSASVTLAISGGPGATGLSCTTNPVTTSSGAATFSGCQIGGLSGNNYTLSAAASGFTTVNSNQFSITAGTASQLAFTTQPGGGASNATWAAQPVVKVEDSFGNTVTSGTGSNASITLAIASQPGTGTLSCTTNPKSASAGVDTFSGCKIAGTAGSYTLSAAASGFSTVTSNPFSITFGTATQLVVTTTPNGDAAGAVWTTQPVVTVEDASGNTVTSGTGSNASISLAINSGPGAGFSCTTNPLAASAGVASFAGCKISGLAGSYTLKATASGLTQGNSGSFSITVGAASSLVFTTQPGGASVGSTWTNEPVVSVEDGFGNVVTSTNSGSVTMSIVAGGPQTNFTSGTSTVNVVNGVATFSDLLVNSSGGYTLTATPGSIAGVANAVNSAGFTVNPAAEHELVVTTQPASSIAAGDTVTVGVTIEDTFGNTVTTGNTGSTDTLQVALSSDAFASGTTSLAAVNGVATFTGLQVTTTDGSPYTIHLTDVTHGAVAATDTSPFTVTPGTVQTFTFIDQTSNAVAGQPMDPQVSVQTTDQFGNSIPSSGVPVTLTVSSGSIASGDTATTDTNGFVVFPAITIDTAGSGLTLTATASGFTNSAPSATFAVVADAAHQLVFGQGPSDAFVGASIAPAVTVQLQDEFGNNVLTSGVPVTLSPLAGVIDSGATANTNAAGLATFGAIKINTAAVGLTLNAASAGLIGTGPSSSFNITVPVSNGAALTDAAADSASGVGSVSYYYCGGYSGTCDSSNWTLIGTGTDGLNSFPFTWNGQPANGPYRLVAVGTDNVTNVSSPSASIPVTVGNQAAQTITFTSAPPSSPAVGSTYTPTATGVIGLDRDDHDRPVQLVGLLDLGRCRDLQCGRRLQDRRQPGGQRQLPARAAGAAVDRGRRDAELHLGRCAHAHGPGARHLGPLHDLRWWWR